MFYPVVAVRKAILFLKQSKPFTVDMNINLVFIFMDISYEWIYTANSLADTF